MRRGMGGSTVAMGDAMGLTQLPAGTPVVVGTRVIPMPALRPGDRVLAVGRVERLVVISAEAQAAAVEAVREAEAAVAALGACTPARVDVLSGLRRAPRRPARLGRGHRSQRGRRAERRGAWSRHLAPARRREDAGRHGRGAPGLGDHSEPHRRGPRAAPGRGLRHRAPRGPLGVVAFVFHEKAQCVRRQRGVVRSSSCAVMRIGGDALDTALAIEEHALRPALRAAGLSRSGRCGSCAAASTPPNSALHPCRREARGGSRVRLLGAVAEQHRISFAPRNRRRVALRRAHGFARDARERPAAQPRSQGLQHAQRTRARSRGPGFARTRVRARILQALGAQVHRAGSEGISRRRDLAVEELSREGGVGDSAELRVRRGRRPRGSGCATTAGIVPTSWRPCSRAVRRPSPSSARVDARRTWATPSRAGSTVSGRGTAARKLGLTNWERGRLLGRSGFLSGDDIVTVRDVFLDTTGEAAAPLSGPSRAEETQESSRRRRRGRARSKSERRPAISTIDV